MGASDASGSIDIAATPDAVYALVTDLPTLADLADEAASMRWTTGTAARPGAVFRGTNRNGLRRWSTTCTVTDAEPGRRFAFDVRYTLVPIARWEYRLEASELGCRVTESTWDRRPPGFWLLGGLATGVQDRATANSRHIEATLRRLKDHAESH